MIVCWILFALFSIFHIVVCFLEKEKIRKISKIFILPFLALCLIVSGLRNAIVFIGLFLGWIGDIFLIVTGKQKRKFFIIGSIFFALGHIFYIVAEFVYFLSKYDISEFPYPIYIICIVALAVLFLIGYLLTKKIGKIGYFGAFYFFLLSSALIVGTVIGRYMLVLGFIFFTISDSLIVISRLFKSYKRSHFYIMVTYIVAQVLITVSYILQI